MCSAFINSCPILNIYYGQMAEDLYTFFLKVGQIKKKDFFLFQDKLHFILNILQ